VTNSPAKVNNRNGMDASRTDPSLAEAKPRIPKPPSGPPPAALLLASHNGIPKPCSLPGSTSSLVDGMQLPRKRARHGTVLSSSSSSSTQLQNDISSQRQHLLAALAKRRRTRLSITTCSFIVKKSLDWDPDLDIDMRCFRDPHASAELKEHDGHNIIIIDRMVNHRDFPAWLSWLKEHLYDHLSMAEEERRPEVKVVMFCRSGQHRAVAGSVILSFLAHKLGLSCGVPHHMTIRRCTCLRCRGNSQELSNILNSVWDRWQATSCDND